MLNVKYIKGNIVELAKNKEVDAVAHGCNCFHTMGSGIAPQLNKATNGKLLEVDKTMPYGDINNLGKLTFISHEGTSYFNLYSQYVHGGHLDNKKLTYVNWSAFEQSLKYAIEIAIWANKKSMAIPYIGCGLAGGDISDFKARLSNLQEYFSSSDDLTLFVVEYNG